MLIFEKSSFGRAATAQFPKQTAKVPLPTSLLRNKPLRLPECSELQVIRHFTQLSQKNFAIDTNFYPLGSCTMKYNPRGVQKAALHPYFQNRHPLTPAHLSQGLLSIIAELQTYLCAITGMQHICLAPMAGSQGEFAGVAMIKAYHHSRQDFMRTQILIPDAAHGTNPASAAMCGMEIIELPTAPDGDIDIDILKQHLSARTAGIMLTNPSTLGLFTKKIIEIAHLVHQAGGLLYYDGANLNAIVGEVRPGDMGFDVMHLNLHKTFATPHGGGGPGSGPVACNATLAPFLPFGVVQRHDNQLQWSSNKSSIGRLSAFMGNVNMLLRAYFYIRMLGRSGIKEIGKYATLNANYLMAQLQQCGYTAAYPCRRASHEFIISLQKEKLNYGVTAMDVAKRLLDFNIHAPTTYFPLLVPECLLIEPTETECKEELDAFVTAMQKIRHEITNHRELLKQAPHTTPLSRLNDVRAARELNLNYFSENAPSVHICDKIS